MAAKLVRSPSLLLVLLAVALWTSSSCVLILPAAMADHTTVQPAASSSSAQPSLPAAGVTTAGTLPAVTPSTPAAGAAAASAELPPAKPAIAGASEAGPTATAATAPQKFPLPTQGGPGEPVVPANGGGPGEPVVPEHGGVGEPYLPAAEVAGALPVPTPDELPSGASLGFGGNGLGYGGPGDECCGGPGGYGWFGGPGGFGPGTYGYSGPLYWGAAPAAAGLERVTNVVLALVVAYVSAAILA